MALDYELILKVAREGAPTVATLIAAFFGAWFAYLLENRRRQRESERANIDAANRALFVLFQQLNSIKIIQKDFIDPVRGDPGAFLSMQALLPDDHQEMKYEFLSLSFILATRHKQLLLDLWLEQQRFHEAIKALNFRSAFHMTQVQPVLQAAGIQEGKEYLNTLFKDALGPLRYTTLQRATEQAIYHVDRTVKTLDELRRRLADGLAEIFPGATLLKFELIEEPANPGLQADAPQAPRR